MVTIVYLTLKEAVRRRATLICVLVALALLGASRIPLLGRFQLLPPEEASRVFVGLYVFFATSIVKFFASGLAIGLAAGTISTELERGLLSSILPKPISRLAVYGGKWLGIFLFCAASVVVWELVIYGVAAYREPGASHRNVWESLPYVLLYPAVFTTLGMLFSNFASFPLAFGMTILAAGVGWSEGTFHVLNRAFDIRLLATLSKMTGYVVPLGRMSRWASEALGPLPALEGELGAGTTGPFRDIETTGADLAYVIGYVALLFVLGAVLFQRRDV
ncbi:MAG TPA: ABC transporter permease [Armatimonadaceae bacterium]|jgi:ABC-type transport system involved in multi-copper enzyme maturation permease subunit|nr:ABC transporter permease [Armatimonadaceae bacterium]